MTPGKFQMLSKKKKRRGKKTNDSETLEPSFFHSKKIKEKSK